MEWVGQPILEEKNRKFYRSVKINDEMVCNIFAFAVYFAVYLVVHIAWLLAFPCLYHYSSKLLLLYVVVQVMDQHYTAFHFQLHKVS
jgi:hypothetical protein